MRVDANSSQSNNFDIIRFFFACIVILSHSFPIGTGSNDSEPFFMMFETTMGDLAVAGFFTISGYLILASWQRRKSLFDYMRKRFLRIYPGWLTVNLLTIIILLAMSMISLREFLNWIPGILILKQFETSKAFATNIYSGTINGSLWSIPYEWACYLVLMGIGFAQLLRSPRRLAIFTGVVLLVAAAINVGADIYELSVHPRLFLLIKTSSFFLVGSCFYEYREKIEFHKTWFFVSLAGCLLAGLVPIVKPLILPVAMTYAVFYAAFQRRICFHHFGKYGDFSYGIYLYAFPIQQMIVYANGGSMNPFLLFLLATPASILAGIASWYGVERWCLPRRRRRETANLHPSTAGSDQDNSTHLSTDQFN
ncbi:acyltransferase [Bremerella cremea]|uniref:Acyltransferase 3 domain-containing protein n=1 Tax=Blastopirellula marina TaxID=124 RepID=A0A2S8FKZ6_9BACT|nr:MULTISPECIES: acyltransferase [Pirellulaceae]PQO32827.1 hypothetical protein C5Y83_21840 [Blastopirellula marina]RCS45894.1 acyltransferase [Bremerella cremea]